MAHRLSPITEDGYLEPQEIVRRLRAEFEFVEADADAGTEVVADMIKQFQRTKAPQEMIDAHRAMLGKAIRVVVSDREDFEDDRCVRCNRTRRCTGSGRHRRRHSSDRHRPDQ
ncbi:MAG: hypothetical protein KY475_20190 [Planctomycetes bacterium]|nr:hypothetical protein [Planctomycetota bacterium]